VILARDSVHVWLAFESEVRDEATFDRFEPLLSAEERVRCARFRTLALQRTYLLARALQRTVLSRYAPAVSPAEWQFAKGEHDKPSLAAPFEAHGLHFNLSHARGLVAFAVARAPLGIDVENLALRDPPLEVARNYFTPFEADALERLPAEARPARFFALWTLKESWLKADGRGLSAGLENAEFELDAMNRVTTVRLAGDDAGAWSFRQWWPSPEHVMALGVRHGAAPPPRVEMQRFVAPG
jgi:4'-phosphopantetheinyl transferase